MNDRQQMKEHYRQIVKEKYGIENFDIEPMKPEWKNLKEQQINNLKNRMQEKIKEYQQETERECPECGGDGFIAYPTGNVSPHIPYERQTEKYICPECHGSGKIQEKAGGAE